MSKPDFWFDSVISRMALLTFMLLTLSSGLLLGATWQEHNFAEVIEDNNLAFCTRNSTLPLGSTYITSLENISTNYSWIKAAS